MSVRACVCVCGFSTLIARTSAAIFFCGYLSATHSSNNLQTRDGAKEMPLFFIASSILFASSFFFLLLCTRSKCRSLAICLFIAPGCCIVLYGTRYNILFNDACSKRDRWLHCCCCCCCCCCWREITKLDNRKWTGAWERDIALPVRS